MQASKKHSFLRRSPLAYVVVPLAFVLVSTALVFIVGRTVLAPYQALLGWFFSTTEVAQPRDLLDNAATVINGGTVDEPDAQPDRLPLSSVTYPSEGDRYATITISGTNVDAPVYYGDTSKILNAGVGRCPRRHSRRGQDHPAGRAQQHLLQRPAARRGRRDGHDHDPLRRLHL